MLKAFLTASLTLLLLVTFPPVVAAAECTAKGAPNAGKTINRSKASEILERHKLWLSRYVEAGATAKYWGDSDQADFRCAKLADITFNGEDLRYARLDSADLEHVNFYESNLSGARLYFASLKRVEIRKTKAVQALIIGTKFDTVSFSDSDLSAAELTGVSLATVYITKTNLQGVDLHSVNLAGAVIDPGVKPISDSVRLARGIADVRFLSNPDTLIELREAFKRGGRRDLERQITFAIQSTWTSQAMQQGKWLLWGARYFGWELPTAYDLAPDRALIVIGGLIFVFAVPYWIGAGNRIDPKIWRVLPPDRLNGDGKPVFEPMRLSGFRRIALALAFSIYSAFSLGWRDLNVGSWLTRLQGTEYTLRAQGWVRSVSGGQSLISVYLLAMWVLTQFGRLFDG